MRKFLKGEGEPELVVVGAIHGDEPAGKNAIERVLNEDIKFQRPVKFIVANQEALEKEERFVDRDLNDSFPGDPDSSQHEERLAAEITEEVKGKTVIDLHSTRSTSEPFATMKDTDEKTVELLKHSGVERGICFPSNSGVLIEQASNGLIVETGVQGTENAEKDAYRILKNFLAAEQVIEESYTTSEPELYRYIGTVEGDWRFEAENFRKVEKGETYASRKNDELVASESFYPVLMSTDGYEGKLGYKAEKIQ
ncbi:MAG: succinylglutamate desuccinylase/aspartoacylase family protein [Candidatus Nanohalobium sp.]